jgi:hypothetical protein
MNAWPKKTANVRTFELFSGDQKVAEGVIFSNNRCVVHWFAWGEVSFYEDVEEIFISETEGVEALPIVIQFQGG